MKPSFPAPPHPSLLLLGVTAAPVGHAFGQSGSWLDEVISFGLIGVIIAGLLVLQYLGRRDKRRRKR